MAEPPAAKHHAPARTLVARLLLLGVAALLFRFAFVVVNQGLFSPNHDAISLPSSGTAAAALARVSGDPSAPSRGLWTSKKWRKAVDLHSSAFQSLISDGFLSPGSKSLVAGTVDGHEVVALKEIGVPDSIGVSEHPAPPLVVAGKLHRLPFKNSTFDFVFSGAGADIDGSSRPHDVALEISRTLKPKGFLAIHTSSAGDPYSLHSLAAIFPSLRLIRSRELAGDPPSSTIREVVLQKLAGEGENRNPCRSFDHKLEIVGAAEPLIEEEPLKPWITLKRNIKNVRYLPSMADISFKRRYIYVDVGSRSFGSSIGGWFRKQYPKQNRSFEVFAVEADPAFHGEYRLKKGVNLLPFAAWVRNETLAFDVKHDVEEDEQGLGMGRIRPAAGGGSPGGNGIVVEGFDFAEWLKATAKETDFVVVKMDVEGTEFDLVPRMVETGAMCLVDELFLECHYSRWQRCCPGKRSPKYSRSYGECMELFTSLRESGVLVHQWW